MGVGCVCACAVKVFQGQGEVCERFSKAQGTFAAAHLLAVCIYLVAGFIGIRILCSTGTVCPHRSGANRASMGQRRAAAAHTRTRGSRWLQTPCRHPPPQKKNSFQKGPCPVPRNESLTAVADARRLDRWSGGEDWGGGAAPRASDLRIHFPPRLREGLPEGLDGYGGWPRGSSPPTPWPLPTARSVRRRKRNGWMDLSLLGQGRGANIRFFFGSCRVRLETRRDERAKALSVPTSCRASQPPAARGGGSPVLLVHSLLPTFVG